MAQDIDRKSRRAWRPALAHELTQPVIAVVMGVSGSGKSVIGTLLAAALGCQFQEGDNLHPLANLEKMSHGIPLTDEDRVPWLRKIAEKIDEWRKARQSGVVACSVLKRCYRDMIIGSRAGVTLVYLRGSCKLIGQRMIARHGHFMPASLLDSQFATLEEPTPDEHPVTVDIAGTLADIVERIVQQLEDREVAARAVAPRNG